MSIKGAAGEQKPEGRTKHSMGNPNPNGGFTVMQAFPPRTMRRQGRQENLNLLDERGMVAGSRERNSVIAGT